MDSPRDALHRQLERWQLRASRAQAARGKGDVAELDEQIAEREADLERPGERSERMRALAARLSLDAAEIDLLWWLVASAVDPAVARASDALGGGRARRGTSITAFSEVAALTDEAARDLAIQLAHGHPLIATGLVRALDEDVTVSSALAASPRLIAYLRGSDTPDAPVERVEVRTAQRASRLFDRDQLRTLAQLAELAAPTSRVTISIEGPARTGRRTAVAFATNRPVLSIDFERIAGAPAIHQALRALRRELALTDGIAVLSNFAIDRAASDALTAVSAFIGEHPGPVYLTTSVSMPPIQTSRPLVRVRWSVPDTAVRRALWQQALRGRDPGPDLDAIAMRYRLGPGGIARAVASARATRPQPLGDQLTGADLTAGVRHNIAEGMAGLATRVEVTQTWDDAVLSDDTRDQVHALIARLKHAHLVLEQWGYRSKLARGTGVAALFSGPPGTGKTMCAGLIARELDLELYQVDLSQVVSKWVGETEKQLARVFDSAEAGHALLLFDEADALFGQRSTETRGAVDRYANLEVNFLLQRIESFGGITILTTNLDTAIDKALKRRLAGHIVFAAPDEDERADLWRRLTRTGSAPLAPDLDFEDLAATFSAMTGANIRNAAIAAAFYAARDGAKAIGQEHLMRAGRAEYRSMGHMLTERKIEERSGTSGRTRR
jgi:AAA+ superfamily predicted ATPase